jgi:hypothetical protein
VKQPPRGRDGRGMVTAELAVATLAALTLLLAMLWGIYLVVLQLRCVDTAAAVARQAARGDAAGVRLARAQAPAGAQVSVLTRAEVVTVSVRLRTRSPAAGLGSVTLQAGAQVPKEPGGDS